MSRKKAEVKSEKRVSVIHLQGAPAEYQWLEELHSRTHLPKATIVRLALADWAQKNGHPGPPSSAM